MLEISALWEPEAKNKQVWAQPSQFIETTKPSQILKKF